MADRMKIDMTNHRKSRNEDFYREFFSSSSGSDDDSEKSPKRKHKKLSDLSDLNVEPHSCPFCGHSKIDVASAIRARLCTELFNHFFQNIWSNSPQEKREQCTYFDCLWFHMYTQESNRENVLSWIKKKNIFSKKYVLIPIVLWNHWYLCIFCHFGEKIDSETRTPCIVLLDSLHELNPWRLKPIIRRLVSDIYETENRVEDKDLINKIPFMVPKVPQQRNGYACGVFALYYASLFLENAPENFSLSPDSDYPYSMDENWFTEEELEGFYKRLESIGIESDQKPIGSDCSSDGISRLTEGEFHGIGQEIDSHDSKGIRITNENSDVICRTSDSSDSTYGISRIKEAEFHDKGQEVNSREIRITNESNHLEDNRITATTNGNSEGQFEGRSRRTRKSPFWHRDYICI